MVQIYGYTTILVYFYSIHPISSDTVAVDAFRTALHIPFYFPDPHAPWQSGTNENTNGLIIKYLPKIQSMGEIPSETVDKYIEKLNLRLKKVLGWKAPYEIFFEEVLHLT